MTSQLVNNRVFPEPDAVLYTPPCYNGSIWENIISLTGVSEERAREIAQELISAYADEEDISCDDDAAQHHELMTEILDVIMDENRKSFFIQNESIEIDYHPFHATHKIKREDLPNLMQDYYQEYYCTICLENVAANSNRGVQLMCGGEHCIYCRECISEWLNKSVARCPYCSHDFHVTSWKS